MKYHFLLTFLLFQVSFSIVWAQSEEDEEISEIATANEKGFDYYSIGYIDSAEYYLSKTLELQEAAYGKYHKKTAETNINLGAIYRKLNNNRLALKHLNAAEDYYTKHDPNSPYLGYIYNNKGNIFYNYSDYVEAEQYYRYCLIFMEKAGNTDLEAYASASINLFNILNSQNRQEEALEFLNKSTGKEFQGGNTGFRKHIFLAEGYFMLNKPDKALEEIEIAYDYYYKYLAPNIPEYLIVNYRAAHIHIDRGEYNEAKQILLKNIDITKNKESVYFYRLFQTYLLVGVVHYLNEDYENCLAWLEKVKNKIEEETNQTYNSEELTSSMIFGNKLFNKEIIDFYRLYGNAAQQYYIETNDINYLKLSLKNYNNSIEYIKALRLHMRNEESILIESEARLITIHEAVNVAAKLYQLTGNYDYLTKAFEYAENMKSFTLYTEIKGGEAMQFSDLPLQIKNRESKLAHEMEAYSELIYNEKAKEKTSQSLLDYYNSAYFKLKDDYNVLLDSIENFYPKYFQLKYNPEFIKPKDIQSKINRNECIVEYVLSDTVLTTFIIDQEKIQVHLQQLDKSFDRNCFDYFTLLQTQDFGSEAHQTYRKYTYLARMFHDILVAPVLERTNAREITFIPDGAIMYLPFESFLTSDVDQEYIDYKNLPYLIFDVSVGYSYSSTLLFSERLKYKSPSKRVLAFAPSYDNLLPELADINEIRQANPDLLLPLPGAKEEVASIKKLVPADVYMDENASEDNFKELASEYSILHLAMHTIMNDEDPMFSKLAFTREENDTIEDQDLFTYEIYNLNLNAEMVVLSSCSSGYGKMQKGEGMMSMARGFIYAGCPSIVMTLWQVSDRSSAELMENFYRQLKKGKSKKESLRQAKIDYIKSSDGLKANPYFWSAFMVVGDNSPLYGLSAAFVYAVIIGGFIILVMLIIYKKRISRIFRR